MTLEPFRQYRVTGTDAYGNPVNETIEIHEGKPRVRYFFMRWTPGWAWNIWWYLGLARFRRVTRIAVSDERPASLPRSP